jgi:hypothetical protein
MESDPAVVAGLMTAELRPFTVALQRKNPWRLSCIALD